MSHKPPTQHQVYLFENKYQFYTDTIYTNYKSLSKYYLINTINTKVCENGWTDVNYYFTQKLLNSL